jgi:class 3 adenylate cyclase
MGHKDAARCAGKERAMTTNSPGAEQTFGDVLRHYRRAANLTQEELAERSGLAARSLSDLERGVNRYPRRETVLAIADGLHLSSDDRAALLAASRRRLASEAVPGASDPASVMPETSSDVRTFLFVDMRGFTRYTAEHGDEAAGELAETFAQLVREWVAPHGGTLIELRGDGALVAFGSPRAALRAAVALQARVAETHFPVPLGMGLDAGEAVPVEGGFRGGALNLASRLCDKAAPGEVLATEGVVHIARRVADLAYLDRGTVELKGLAEPVHFYQILPAEPNQATGDTVSRLSSPEIEAAERTAQHLPVGGYLGALPEGSLVARKAELERLLALLETAGAGVGRFVILTGEPGIGKTRLAQEVTREAHARDFLIAAGRCYQLQQSVPYYPFLEALTRTYAAAPAALRAELPRRWAEVARLLPDQDVGVPASHGGYRDDQQRLFYQVTGFLQALAKRQPLAVLLDDLQWADSASLALLQHLARQTREDRILLVATYRDVEVSRASPLEVALRELRRERLVERVSVPRLSAEGTKALIGETIGEQAVSDQLATLLFERAEGAHERPGALLVPPCAHPTGALRRAQPAPAAATTPCGGRDDRAATGARA